MRCQSPKSNFVPGNSPNGALLSGLPVQSQQLRNIFGDWVIETDTMEAQKAQNGKYLRNARDAENGIGVDLLDTTSITVGRTVRILEDVVIFMDRLQTNCHGRMVELSSVNVQKPLECSHRRGNCRTAACMRRRREDGT